MGDTKAVRRALAALPSVQAKVDEATERIGVAAEARFARHDRPGGHHVEVDKDGVDGLVSLVGPAPVPLELGHFTRTAPGKPARAVPGLGILSGALDA